MHGTILLVSSRIRVLLLLSKPRLKDHEEPHCEQLHSVDGTQLGSLARMTFPTLLCAELHQRYGSQEGDGNHTAPSPGQVLGPDHRACFLKLLISGPT